MQPSLEEQAKKYGFTVEKLERLKKVHIKDDLHKFYASYYNEPSLKPADKR